VTPIERLEVPTRVQPLLAARIDRLPEREKQVLQTAAVIGQEFAAPVLEQVAELPKNDLDEALRVLKASEFIYEESLFPVAEYAFKHPLTQAVALDSQLRERRRRVHKAVAKTIEALDADRLDERAALLAHHWEEAGQSLTAARWHRRAAEWTGKNDIAEASRHWHRVLELARESSESDEAAQLGAAACHEILLTGFRLGVSTEEQASLFEEGKRLAKAAGDVDAQGILEVAFSIVESTSGNMAGCIEHALEGERLLLQSKTEEFRVLASWTLVYPRMMLGELEESRNLAVQLEEATRGRPDWGFELLDLCAQAWSVWFVSVTEVYMGDLVTARQRAERGIELARQHGDSETEGWALSWLAELSLVAGDAELSLGPCRRSIEIGEKMGSSLSQVTAYTRLGGSLTLAGQYDEAIEVLEHALRLGRERRTGLNEEVRCVHHLAEAVMHAGDLERARTLADEAVELGRRMGLRIDTVLALRVLGRVLLKQQGTRAAAAIETALDEADQLIEATGARNLGPLILLERAELARAEGDAAAGERYLRVARALFEEMSAPVRVAEIDALLTRS
jgi:adenylate cyclase